MKSRKSAYWGKMWNISQKEVEKSLGIKPLFIQTILILFILIFTAIESKGKAITGENIWSGYWPNIIGLLILVVVSPVIVFINLLWVIPREYRKRQNEIKNLERQLTSGVINANVLLYAISLDADKVYALLKVNNNERSRKITGCRAKLTRFFMTCNNDGGLIDFTYSITAIEFPFFYWQENHDKQIDIEHSDEKILCVATAEKHKVLNLAILKDEYNFPAKISKDGKRFFEIRFELELSGNIGNKGQVFYKTFFGKVTFTSTPINDEGKELFVDEIDFIEISENELVETLQR
jgi:hypothetical protein